MEYTIQQQEGYVSVLENGKEICRVRNEAEAQWYITYLTEEGWEAKNHPKSKI